MSMIAPYKNEIIVNSTKLQIIFLLCFKLFWSAVCKTKTKNSELAPPTGGTFDFKSHATLVVMEFSAHGVRTPNQGKNKINLQCLGRYKVFWNKKDRRPNMACKFASNIAPPRGSIRVHQGPSGSIRVHQEVWDFFKKRLHWASVVRVSNHSCPKQFETKYRMIWAF